MAENIEKLVKQIVFTQNKKADLIVRKIAQEQGIWLDSIQKLYQALAQNNYKDFTVPAINIRTLTFDIARAVFRQVIKNKVGAFIIELARSEISYSSQSMSEYAPVILGAAVKEKFKGPIFLQGDHFQVKAKKFFNYKEKTKEIDSLKNLIRESIKAGVYNIDIDASTLVKLEPITLRDQQFYNYELTSQFTSFVRSIEPKGVTVCLGGEIGEIGGKNSEPEELAAFMDGYIETLPKGEEGIIKISIQSGTKHGGFILPSGEVKKISIDFETLEKLSKEAKKYKLVGVVQHGASTLPEEYFDEFPKRGIIEIHLATEFQNLVYDSPYFPSELKEKIYNWLKKEMIKERLPEDTEEQFLYKTRKRALGPFKKEIWAISQKDKDKICEVLEEKFSLLFQKLNVNNTKELVDKIYFKP